MASIPTRAINLARQLIAITAVLPESTATIRDGELNCMLHLRPSPASQVYTVYLAYRHWRPPHVTVNDPQLILHPGATALPHVYADDELCLYNPGQWNDDMLRAATIVPWTPEWLMHYELWLVTGTWFGGGEPCTVDRQRHYRPASKIPRWRAASI